MQKSDQLISVALTLTEFLYLSTKWIFRRHVKPELPFVTAAGGEPSAPPNEIVKRNRFEEVVYRGNRQQGLIDKYDRHIKKRYVAPPPSLPAPPNQLYPARSNILDDEGKV